jgi:DNA-binding NarL/FixJ family response regulator
VLTDVRMPVLDGIEATRRIVALDGPPVHVLMLTTFDLDEYLFEALRAGVLELVAAGLTNAEIAARLQLDGDAIDATVSQVLAKLGVRDRVHAVLVAYEARLIR